MDLPLLVIQITAVLFCTFTVNPTDASYATGRAHYHVAFMDHPGSSSIDMSLFITNPNTATVYVSVYLYGLLRWHVSNKTISPGETYVADNIPTALHLEDSEKYTESVRVDSTGDVVVQVYSERSTSFKRSAFGFTALPRSMLGKEYLVATQCTHEHCIFIVTSVEDDNDITVTIQLPSSKKAEYENNDYHNGDTIHETLDEGESMQIFAKEADLTGTLVVASKDVAVFSGGKYTKAFDSAYLYTRDTVAEQMVPIDRLGREYFLRGPGATTTDKVKVVTVNSTGNLSIGNSEYMVSKSRQVFEVQMASLSGVGRIVSDWPVLVVAFSCNTLHGSDYGVTMTSAVPVEQWTTTYQVYVPTSMSVFLLLVVPSNCTDFVDLSGVNAYYFVSGFGYTSLTASFQTEEQLIHVQCEHPDCLPFTGYVASSQTERAVTYSLRDSFSATHREEHSLTTQTSVQTDSSSTSQADNSMPPPVINSTTTQPIDSTTNSVWTNYSSTSQVDNSVPSLVNSTPTQPIDSAANSAGADSSRTSQVDNSLSSQVVNSTTTQPTDSTTTQAFDDSTTLYVEDTTTQNIVYSTAYRNISAIKATCRCVKNRRISFLSIEESNQLQREMINAIKTELTEDKTTLSSYIRSKESSPDERESSQTLGSIIGITTCVLVLVFIVGTDAITFTTFIVKRFGNRPS